MITDQLLITAAEAYEKALLITLPEETQCDHTFSARFQRKMERLCRQVRYSAVHIWMKRIASIFVVLVCIVGMLLLANGQVRAAVVDWFKEIYGRYTGYSFTGEQTENTEPCAYEITDLPDEYVLLDQHAGLDGGFTIYVNPDGEYLNLEFLTYSDPGMLFLAVEEYSYSYTVVDGIKMEIYITNEPGQTNSIVWVDSENVLFHISANVNTETLIELAQSVAKQTK